MMGSMTNYQKVRLMQKKDFAEWMAELLVCPLCPVAMNCEILGLDADRGACAEQLEAWLDQEAE